MLHSEDGVQGPSPGGHTQSCRQLYCSVSCHTACRPRTKTHQAPWPCCRTVLGAVPLLTAGDASKDMILRCGSYSKLQKHDAELAHPVGCKRRLTMQLSIFLTLTSCQSKMDRLGMPDGTLMHSLQVRKQAAACSHLSGLMHVLMHIRVSRLHAKCPQAAE